MAALDVPKPGEPSTKERCNLDAASVWGDEMRVLVLSSSTWLRYLLQVTSFRRI